MRQQHWCQFAEQVLSGACSAGGTAAPPNLCVARLCRRQNCRDDVA